ncbi:hypothetical protein V2J09_010107 [Rumex salicifolius]
MKSDPNIIIPSMITTKGEAAAPAKKKHNGGKFQLSTDPQSVAARERRHRISHRLKTLQSMVPGAAKLDTVSLLDQAIHYVHFLNSQIRFHQFLLRSNYSYADVAFPVPAPAKDPLLLLTPPPPPPLMSPPDYNDNSCCFGVVDVSPAVVNAALPPWSDAGAFEEEGCFCSGGSTSTSTLNF